MPIITLSTGARFSSEPGESILNAAGRASVAMAYSCRTGRCSSCKSQVLDGQSAALTEETGLSEQEKAEGWILSCARVAESDLHLAAEDLGGMVIPPAKTLPCRIHALEKLAPDVMKVVLRLPPTGDFAFLPGQYIDVLGQGSVRRSYSIANACSQAKQLELHIREVPGGAMSEFWFGRAKVNDLLRLNGPLGTFFLRDITGLDLVFLATGTGFAPVKAMLEGMETLPLDSRPRSVTVYWGGRAASSLYWDVASADFALSYVPVLSRPTDDWTGAVGYVQDVLMGDEPDLRQLVVYACGSDEMINAAKKLLIAAGLPEKKFFSDAFVSSGE